MPLIQRKRRVEPEEDASPESSPEPAAQRRRTSPPSEDDAYNADAGATQGDGNTDVLVKKLVRLALACEYQRRPIRRADVGDKVLGSNGRAFRKVFEQAQIELKSVFGMEMVELPAREKVTLAQKRAAQKAGSQSKTTASWVLKSNLPPQYHDPEIIPPPAIPTSAEESKYVALYTTLISLISLAGGSVQHDKFLRYLRRTNLEDTTPIDGYEKTDKLLARMQRENYIVRIREAAGPSGEEDVYWIVGPRGKVEVGDDGVRGLAKAVYGEMNDKDEDELDRKLARSLGVSEVVERSQQQNGQPKKKGRKRKDEQAEEQEEEEKESDDDDD